MKDALYRDLEWYFCARHASVGYHGQNIEGGTGAVATDSGALLERFSDVVDRGYVAKARRIEDVLFRLPPDVVRDLKAAFEPFGVERAWITLQKAFTRSRLNVLLIAETRPLAIAECRSAYRLTDEDPALEPIMVREWFHSVLKKHYMNHAGELPRAHVLSHIVEDAHGRVLACLSMYDVARASTRHEQSVAA